MKKVLTILLAFIGLSASAQTGEILTNEVVVELYKEGFGENLIITKIKTTKNTFDVSLNGLKLLRKDSIPQSIIEVMLEYADKNKAADKADAGALPTPPFVNTPMWLDTGTYELKPFERRVVNRKEKSSAAAVPVIGAIFAGGESSVAISEVSSNVIFETAQLPRIFVKVNPGIDPSTSILLYKYSINFKKDQRELITQNRKEGIASTNSGGSLTNIITNFKQVAPDVYEITPAQPLTEGEYGFANASLTEMYAFRVWKAAGNNNIPPPAFNRIKADLMGSHVEGWDFDSQTRFDKVEQLNLEQSAHLISYTYLLSLSKPQKGADLRKEMTIIIRYKKGSNNNWMFDRVNIN